MSSETERPAANDEALHTPVQAVSHSSPTFVMSPTTNERVDRDGAESEEYFSMDSDVDEAKPASKPSSPSRMELKAESEARALERLRVMEAAGLIVRKPNASSPPPRPPRRRPQPLTPNRKSKPRADGHKGLPPTPSDSILQSDDAYCRYEAFRNSKSQSSVPTNRYSMVSNASVDSYNPPGSPVSISLSITPSFASASNSSTGGAESRLEGFLHSFFGKPTTHEKRLSVSGPIISGPIPLISSAPEPLTRQSSPAFGLSWSSLVDKDVLEGIPAAERKRQEAIFEFIHTEGDYVRDLQLVVEVFYSSMIPMLEEKDVSFIFANIEDILLANTGFLSSLEQRQKECRLYVDEIGDIILSHLSNMAVYMPYCSNQGPAIKVLQSIRSSNAEVASHLQRLRDGPLVRNLDLSSYLLIPMQRITRYPLLIRQILNYTEGGEERERLETALMTAESILDSINENIREREGGERLAAISQHLFIGQGQLDLTAPTKFMGRRRLLKEGLLTKSKSGRKLHAFLCSDVLVLTDAGVNSLYRMPIPLGELQIREPGLDDSTFHLELAYPRGGGNIGLRASSAKDCQSWVDATLQAIHHCQGAERKAARRSSWR